MLIGNEHLHFTRLQLKHSISLECSPVFHFHRHSTSFVNHTNAEFLFFALYFSAFVLNRKRMKQLLLQADEAVDDDSIFVLRARRLSDPWPKQNERMKESICALEMVETCSGLLHTFYILLMFMTCYAQHTANMTVKSQHVMLMW